MPSKKQLDFNAVVAGLTNIEGVKEVHNLNIWCLTMDKIALTVHLAIGNFVFFYILSKKIDFEPYN